MFTKFTYWYAEEGIDPEFCNFVLSRINWDKDAKPGRVNQELYGNIDEKVRKTDIVWENPSSVLGIVLQAHVKDANVKAEWNFDLTHALDLQLSRYQENGGHYIWHRDSFAPKDGEQRKLSMIVLLNDSSNFEGGAFEIEGQPDFPGLHKAGSLVIFPSYIKHRVTPVTKGTRYTATCWVNGPAFR